MKRKIVSILSLMILFTLFAGLSKPLIINANEIQENISEVQTAQSVTSVVTTKSNNDDGSNNSAFIVAIPQEIELFRSKYVTFSGNYLVGVKAVLASDAKVLVTPTATFNMTDENIGETYIANVTQDITTWVSNDATPSDKQIKAGVNDYTYTEGSISVDIEKSGEYKGRLGFTVALESSSEAEASVAGVYDANGIMLASWDELTDTYGLDVSQDFSNPMTDTYSLFYILCYNESLINTTKIIIGDDVTKIGKNAFYMLSPTPVFESVIVPDTVTEIGEYAFGSVNYLYYYGTAEDTLENNWGALYLNSNIDNSTTEEDNYYTEEDFIYKDESKTILTGYIGSNSEITVPDGVITIYDDAFRDNTLLTSVTVPDSVTTIGNYAFYGCNALETVNLSNSISTIGNYAFEYTGLTNIVIPASTTSIGDGAFYGCSSLASATIESGSIGYEAFRNTNLTSLNLGSGVTEIGVYAFFGSSFTNLVIPNSVTKINAYAFQQCENLTDLTICSVETMGNYAFANCSNLTNLTIGDNVSTIGDYAFYYCRNLNNVIIPDSVNSIGNSSFYYCDTMTEITIGDGVKTIGDMAFRLCYGLATVHYNGTQEQWNEIAIGTDNTCLTNATIMFND